MAIRSGKHSSSTAYAHALDFDRFYSRFLSWIISKSFGANKVVKPIFIVTVDGDPDENPRYQKVIEIAIHHFVKYDLDAFFVATNGIFLDEFII